MVKNWNICSGQIFLDNWIYTIMVCKMVNAVNEQGNYWIANNFIWNWLLVPVLALGEIIKKDCGKEFDKSKMSNYWKIIIGIFCIWILSIPTWNYIFKYFMNVNNNFDIFKIVIMLVPFYICFMITEVLDSIFCGLGKTYYNFIISFFVNIIYYGIMYILFKQNVFPLNITFIICMFGFGMIIHTIISIILYIHFKKHYNTTPTI